MTTLAMQSKARKLAAYQAQRAHDNNTASAAPLQKAAKNNHDFSLLTTALEQDLKQLADFKQVAQKREYKKTVLLPKYADAINAYLAADAVYDNPLLVYYTIWLFDVGDIERALQMVDVCLEQGQPMPARFNRDVQTWAADETHDWARAQFEQGHSVSPYFDDVYQRIVSGEWTVHEAVQGKFARLAAERFEQDGKLSEALDAYETALAFGEKVKTKLARVQKLLGEKNNP